jgi:hypothetical protein
MPWSMRWRAWSSAATDADHPDARGLELGAGVLEADQEVAARHAPVVADERDGQRAVEEIVQLDGEAIDVPEG